MKVLLVGITAATAGFIYGKLHGTDHPWRRHGYSPNYTPPNKPAL